MGAIALPRSFPRLHRLLNPDSAMAAVGKRRVVDRWPGSRRRPTTRSALHWLLRRWRVRSLLTEEIRMNTLTDRIDPFVRWFFNSSPDRTSIEPRATSGLDQPVVRRSALAVAVVAAIALLLIFHSVVAGAVERAAHRRADAELLGLQTATRHVAQSTRFATRKVSVAGNTD
jgi:hypothetical protein